jgi:hypothetical protein
VAETISGLTPGRRYLVTGWVQTEDGSPVYVGAFDNDNTADVKGYSGTWEKLSVVYTAGTGQTTAEVFCIMKAGGTGFCTDMSFRAIERS